MHFVCRPVATPLSSSSVYLEAAGKEVQFREERRISVQSLQTEHALETHFRCLMSNGNKNTECKSIIFLTGNKKAPGDDYLVIHHPAEILKVAVGEESGAVELHPRAQLLHTDGADFRKHVAARTDKKASAVGTSLTSA